MPIKNGRLILLMILITGAMTTPRFVSAAETVGTTSHTLAGDSTGGYRRKGFYDEGLFWAFYVDTNIAGWKTSENGVDWSDFTSIGACLNEQTFSVWFDGEYAHYTRESNYDLFYRRGVPIDNGSITWSADEQIAYDGVFGNYYAYPNVAVDSEGYAWIGAQYDPGGLRNPRVLKNDNIDGTWSTDFSFELSSTGQSLWLVSVIPLTNGDVYALYCDNSGSIPRGKLYNGTGWSAEESTFTDDNADFSNSFSAVANENDIHFVYFSDSNQIRYNTRVFGVGWGANDVLVQDVVEAGTSPALSIDTGTGELYCFWTELTPDFVFYKKYNGTWDTDPTDWINESSAGIFNNYHLTSFYQEYGESIGVIYLSRTSTPYNVRFDFLTVEAPIEPVEPSEPSPEPRAAIWSQYLSSIASFMNTTSREAGIIMSLILIIALLLAVLIVTKGKEPRSTIPITSLFSILLFTFIGWFPVWTGSVIALVLVLFIGYIFSKYSGG